MKKTLALCILVAGCLTIIAAAPAANSSSAQPAPAAKTANNEIIAKGKGIEIRRAQLDEAMSNLRNSMRNQNVPPEQFDSIKPQLLERLIGMQLLAAKATDADKAAAKENSEKRIAEVIKAQGGQENLNNQLKTLGISMDEFRSKVNEETLAEVVAERELKIIATDADAKKFYEDNPSQFEQPEMVRASHVLIMTQDKDGKPLSDEQKKEKRKQIEDLLKRARAGEDFAKLAKDYSEDPGSKDKGGEYEFRRGQMVPEFEKAAFSLKTNEVSDVVTTQYGYHIIKLSENKPARKIPYTEVETRLKDGLKARSMQQQMPDLVNKLKKEADVQILDETLKLPPPELPKIASPSADTAGAGEKKKK